MSAGCEFSTDVQQQCPVGQNSEATKEAVEYLAEQTIAALPQPIPPAQLRRIIAAATDPEDLGRRLALAYRGRGTDYQALLEQALCAADVQGYANAEEGRD